MVSMCPPQALVYHPTYLCSRGSKSCRETQLTFVSAFTTTITITTTVTACTFDLYIMSFHDACLLHLPCPCLFIGAAFPLLMYPVLDFLQWLSFVSSSISVHAGLPLRGVLTRVYYYLGFLFCASFPGLAFQHSLLSLPCSHFHAQILSSCLSLMMIIFCSHSDYCPAWYYFV